MAERFFCCSLLVSRLVAISGQWFSVKVVFGFILAPSCPSRMLPSFSTWQGCSSSGRPFAYLHRGTPPSAAAAAATAAAASGGTSKGHVVKDRGVKPLSGRRVMVRRWKLKVPIVDRKSLHCRRARRRERTPPRPLVSPRPGRGTFPLSPPSSFSKCYRG